MFNIPVNELKQQIHSYTDIAIVGMSIKTAQADSLEEFWQNVAAAKDCSSYIDDQRMQDTNTLFSNFFHTEIDDALKKNRRRYLRSGYVRNLDKFDARFFNISPTEASLMDPAQRLFIQTAYHALEDAGLTGERRKRYRTGVYVGFSDDAKITYFQMAVIANIANIAQAISGNLSSILPSRISYTLDLKGPALLVDTACSSALVAVHMACQAIRSGDCEQAVVGGVRYNLLPLQSDIKIGIESHDGRTRTFDDNSDGTGSGEGVGVIVLKPSALAQRDGDRIYAVIKGSAINQDGRSVSLTAPDTDAQTDVICRAWENAGIHPETLDYIEVHGTGTRVGDPIEIAGLSNAFRRYTDRIQFCGVASVKTVTGHLFEGSGIVSLIKAALCLRHKMLTANANFRRPNSLIAFEDSPLYILAETRPWENNKETPRRCGITAFGFSGTNCHLVLEEMGNKVATEKQDGPYLLTLSAKTPTALRAKVQQFTEAIEASDTDLWNLCYSANAGLARMDHRAAFISEDRAQLLAALKQFLHSPKSQREYGVLVHDKPASDATERPLPSLCWESREQLLAFAEAYLQLDRDFDWINAYQSKPGHIISTPKYPFEMQRYWLDIPEFIKAPEKRIEGKFLYHYPWTEAELPDESNPVEGAVCLLHNGQPLITALADCYRAEGLTVFELEPADHFEVLTDHHFRIGASSEDYDRLVSQLRDRAIGKFILAPGLFEPLDLRCPDTLNRYLFRSVYQLFYAIKAMYKHYPEQQTEFAVITNSVFRVIPEDKVQPQHAPLVGLACASKSENYNLTFRCVDIDTTMDADTLYQELNARERCRIAAWRNCVRRVETFTHFDIQTCEPEPLTLHDGCLYLITGGLGGIGLEVAKALSKRIKNPVLAMINRTTLPPRDSWEDVLDLNEKQQAQIRAVRQLEDQGATVVLLPLDISDNSAVHHALQNLRTTYGPVRGIIHGAGVPGNSLLATHQAEAFADVLKPKIDGALILHEATRKDPIDFFVLFSSIASSMNAPGQTDYAAANYFLDSYADYLRQLGIKATAFNWVSWKETGMSVDTRFNIDTLFKSIKTEDAIENMFRLLNVKVNRAVVGELNIQQINTLNKVPYMLCDNLRLVLETQQRNNNPLGRKPERNKAGKVTLLGRENNSYSKIERIVGKIWGEILGITDLPISASFHDLGGDSIMGIQVFNRINHILRITLPEQDMTGLATIATTAQFIENQMEAV